MPVAWPVSESHFSSSLSVSPPCTNGPIMAFEADVYCTVAIKPRKFALAFTLGSLLFMLGFAILHGPWNRKSTLS